MAFTGIYKLQKTEFYNEYLKELSKYLMIFENGLLPSMNSFVYTKTNINQCKKEFHVTILVRQLVFRSNLFNRMMTCKVNIC